MPKDGIITGQPMSFMRLGGYKFNHQEKLQGSDAPMSCPTSMAAVKQDPAALRRHGQRPGAEGRHK
jgi:hypothetical protein